MSYPTLEQYNEALQHPSLSLTDPILKGGAVVTTGLGLPLALCGGFALTYTTVVSGKKYAVRCFHKESRSLEERYAAISRRLNGLNSPHFVDFEFQPHGIRIGGKLYPIVKMAWASGVTLGEFLEANHTKPNSLNALLASLRALSSYLDNLGFAHGDISPGNLMVADFGRTIQLIDYDGMYVDELRAMGSTELGNRNFQHPKRSSSSWDRGLDRFAFICIDVSIRALLANPLLWNKTQSDELAILFRANDYADPGNSSLFKELGAQVNLKSDVESFAAICRSRYDQIPKFEDFLSRRNIPQVAPVSVAAPSPIVKYIPAYPVLDATNYDACLRLVGDKVELIGRVFEVKRDKSRHGKPYIFVNFGRWQGRIVKVSIWSDGLSVIANPPDEKWVGEWVSVIGLMEPAYVSKRLKYSHLSISVTQSNQLRRISASEASFRLSGEAPHMGAVTLPVKNSQIAERIGGGKLPKKGGVALMPHQVAVIRPSSGKQLTPALGQTRTRNQEIVDAMRNKQQVGGSGALSVVASKPPDPAPGGGGSNKNCFIATAIYGPNAIETLLLREWRDSRLLKFYFGRVLVSVYYSVSPMLVPVLERNRYLGVLMRHVLDLFVRVLQR